MEEESSVVPSDFIQITKALPQVLDLNNQENSNLERDLKKVMMNYEKLMEKMVKLKFCGDKLWRRMHTKKGQNNSIQVKDIVLVTNFPSGKKNQLWKVTEILILLPELTLARLRTSISTQP